MTPERYQQVKTLFHEAQELETRKRAEFLASKCNGDSQLRNAVEELLASLEEVEGFIEKPAYAVMAETLVTDSNQTSVEGKRIGSYIVINKIGQGGMGAVYLARRADDAYEKQVAIKLIRRGLDNEDLLKRFYNERQILAQLDHPNIAKLLDGGATEDGLPFFVMDYVEGVPLLDYCDEKNLSTEERLKLFRTVCSAVGHAHQNLIIHRDLKPSNILVREDGAPKLLDFGIAKVFQEDAQNIAEATVTELRVMTPEYASPEQIIGKRVTTSTDIYSLGIILYQLLTGVRPYNFRSQLPQEIARAICEEEAERPSSVVRRPSQELAGNNNGQRTTNNGQKPNPKSKIQNPKSLKGDLDNIALMALRKEPERRYATVEQFSEDIRRHLEGLPVIARADTFTYRASKFVSRNRYAVAAAVLIILLLLAGAVGIIRQGQIAAAERDRAQRERVKAERINKFFQDMLARANVRWYAPGSGKKQDVTIIDALKESTGKIENELNEEPEIKAEILTTIGDTYGSMGRSDLSERPFELALNLRRKLFGDDHIKVAESFYYLGGAKVLLGKKDEGEKLYRQALDIQQKRPNEGNNLPYMLLDYSDLLKGKNDYAGAETYIRQALEIFKQRNGAEDITVGIAHDYLGNLNYDRGDLDKAESEYQEVLKLFTSTQNTFVARVNERRGHIQAARKNYESAETFYRKALEMYLQTYDEKHYTPTAVKINLVINACNRGECEKAKREMEKILAEQIEILEKGSNEMAALLYQMGVVLKKSGEYKRAENYFLESLKVRQQRGAAERRSFAGINGELGECLLEQRRYKEAEPLLLENYNVLKEWQVAHSPSLKNSAERLKKFYFAWGKPEEAAKYTSN